MIKEAKDRGDNGGWCGNGQEMEGDGREEMGMME